MARGISGGQAKRVNIGIALVTNPRVLFLGASRGRWEGPAALNLHPPLFIINGCLCCRTDCEHVPRFGDPLRLSCA